MADDGRRGRGWVTGTLYSLWFCEQLKNPREEEMIKVEKESNRVLVSEFGV